MEMDVINWKMFQRKQKDSNLIYNFAVRLLYYDKKLYCLIFV